MADVDVTVVFMIPGANNSYTKMEFSDVTINSSAPPQKLIPALVNAFPEARAAGFDEEAELLVQAPDGSPLTNVSIRQGCRLLLFPKYGGDIVRRNR
jgi:hypothetical protein